MTPPPPIGAAAPTESKRRRLNSLEASRLSRPRQSLYQDSDRVPLISNSSNQNTLKGETLYICLSANHASVSYAIRSVPVKDLINSCTPQPPSSLLLPTTEKKSLPPLKQVWSTKQEGLSYDMTCAMLGSRFYFFGGLAPCTRPYSPYLYHLWNQSNRVHVYDTANNSFDGYTVSPMGSGKGQPIVVAMEGKFYVIAGLSPVKPDLSFERYTISTNTWEKCQCPPFHDEYGKYWNELPYYGIVVIDKKIHMSSTRVSFVYDVERDFWEPSMLFDNASGGVDDGHYQEEKIPHVRPSCGRPFGFYNQALWFEDDILLCTSFDQFDIVAHKLLDGKVVKSQFLKCQGLVLPPNADTIYLVGLGSGYFCVVYGDSLEFDVTCIVHIQPFLVMKAETTSEDDFLRCIVGDAFSYTNDCSEENGMIWWPVGGFVQ